MLLYLSVPMISMYNLPVTFLFRDCQSLSTNTIRHYQYQEITKVEVLVVLVSNLEVFKHLAAMVD